MKQNERLGTNMRPQPKNDNQKTIRKSYPYKDAKQIPTGL